MQVFLVRHTKTSVPQGICYGQSDVSLAEDNLKDFEVIKAKLPEGFSFCYASPLSRCAKLAHYLRDSLPVVEVDALKEISFGEYELKSWDEIHLLDHGKWMNDFVSSSPPAGESFNELRRRVLYFWNQEILKLPPETQRVLLVTHSGVIRVLLCEFLNEPLEKAFDLKIDFGGVSIIEIPSPFQAHQVLQMNH